MTEENIYTTNTQEENINKNPNISAEEVSADTSVENFTQEMYNTQQPVNPQQVYVTYIPYGLTPETFEERKSIKAAARTVGGAFLGMTGMVLLLNLAVIIATYVIDYSIAQYLFEAAVLHVEQIIFSILSLVVVFGLVFKVSSNKIGNLISFELPQKRRAIMLFMFGIAFCAFSNMAASFLGQIFSFFNIDYNVEMPESPKGIFGFLLVCISTVLVPALAEEFACRGLVLGFLRKFGDGFAIIMSALLFGLMHGNFEQIPFAFLVGLVLGFVTVKSGSIWVAVAIHAFNNGISVFAEYALSSFSQQAQNICIILIFTACMLAGLVAFLFCGNDEKDLFLLKKDELTATEIQKYKWFLTSAPIIIFIIITVLESLLFFVI